MSECHRFRHVYIAPLTEPTGWLALAAGCRASLRNHIGPKSALVRSGIADGGVSMLERALRRRRSLQAESLRSMQLDLPILEPLSAVSRMVALISHDLRHPLTAILANAEFLTQAHSEMDRNDLYQEIRCSVDRMNELVSS